MSAKSALSRTTATIAAAMLLAASSLAQSEPRSTAEQKRGNKPHATHAPQPDLPPALVLSHLRRGNETAAAARAKGETPPRPRPRPAGGGRYICAVLVCADADLDVPALFGLHHRSVLVLSSPGPFVQPEAVALLEHFVSEERLPLVIVLTHPHCATTAIAPGKTPRQTALAARVAEVQRRARQFRHSLPRALARAQREMLLLSSGLMQHAVAADHLRVLPAEVDPKTQKITWHTTRADELPMPPVK